MTTRRWTAWGCVLIWIALIYSTLSLVRPVCNFLKEHTPFEFAVALSLGGIAVGIGWNIYASRRFRRRSTWIMFFATLALYALTAAACPYPEERIHLIQYGVLAFLIFRALLPDLRPSQAYLISFFLASAAGWGDEAIQYILPDRYFQWSDVGLNAWSAVLGLLLTFIIRRDMIK